MAFEGVVLGMARVAMRVARENSQPAFKPQRERSLWRRKSQVFP